MQAMLSDRQGRTLVIEPGIGHRLDTTGRYSLITNYSLLAPEARSLSSSQATTAMSERNAQLAAASESFSVTDGFALLHAVRQEEPWATRVSFVYAASENAVYYVQNNHFDNIQCHRFSK